MQTRTRRRRGAFAGAILLLFLVAVLVVVFATGGNSTNPNAQSVQTVPTAAKAAGTKPSTGPAPTADAATALATAAHNSVAKRTATASAALAPADQSQSIPEHVSGSGAFILASGLGRVKFAVSGSAKAEHHTLHFQGQTVYVKVTNSPVPGKLWVVATTSNLPALGPSSTLSNFVVQMGNPGLMLKELDSAPVTVASLGSASINGASVHRYQVAFPSGPAAMAAFGFGAHSSEEVDVNADQLVQQIVVTGPQVNVNGQSVQETIVVSFTGYGKPVTVDNPPFSEMMSLSQYLTQPVSPSNSAGNSGSD